MNQRKMKAGMPRLRSRQIQSTMVGVIAPRRIAKTTPIKATAHITAGNRRLLHLHNDHALVFPPVVEPNGKEESLSRTPHLAQTLPRGLAPLLA